MALRSALPEAPVSLTDPLDEVAKPAPGCDVCGALARQREEALDASGRFYDPSKASDLLVEIGRHPHKEGRK
ncbi:hypothetical protein BZZ08_03448 [Streptomyces sp. MH60]|nr:hypothetical protein BZZ08_03448 [Streptomyces sp. MH60]